MRRGHAIGFAVMGILATAAATNSKTVGAQPKAQPQENASTTKAPVEARSREETIPDEKVIGELCSEMSPAEIVQDFLTNAYVGEGAAAAFMVSGAEWKSADTHQLGAYIGKIPDRLRWTFSSDEMPKSANALGPAETTITVTLGIGDELTSGVRQQEKITLRQEKTAGGPVWRIVPGDAKFLELGAGEPTRPVSVVGTLATYYAHPKLALQNLMVRKAIAQLKLLGLGTLMLAMDENETYKLTPATFKEKIAPYAKDESAFTAPGDAAGTVSYSFNSELVNLSLLSLKEPAKTVALYLGKEKQLDYRFGGKGIVGFADGHVELIDAEAARRLRWKAADG